MPDEDEAFKEGDVEIVSAISLQFVEEIIDIYVEDVNVEPVYED